MKVWEVRLSSHRASEIGGSVRFQDEKLQTGKNMEKQTGQLQERSSGRLNKPVSIASRKPDYSRTKAGEDVGN